MYAPRLVSVLIRSISALGRLPVLSFFDRQGFSSVCLYARTFPEISLTINMVRDANSNHPGVDGLWFRVREDDKFINPPPLPPGADSDDPTVGWIPLETFITWDMANIADSFGPTTTPSAEKIVATVDLFSDTTYDLYLDKSASTPSRGSDLVDLNQYGLLKDNAIILQVKKDDKAGDENVGGKQVGKGRNRKNRDDSDSDISDA